MAEPVYHYVKPHIEQGVLVLTILPSQLQGDEMADGLRQEMLAAVAAHGADKVAVDFRNVEYLSSASFRPLLSLRRKLSESDGQLMLCGMCDDVAEVFYVTRLVSTTGSTSAPFLMEPDESRAVRRLNGAPGEK